MDPHCADRLGPSFSRFGVYAGGGKAVMAMQLWNKSLQHRLRLVDVFFNAGDMPVRVVSFRSEVYTDEGSLLDLGGSCLSGLCPALPSRVPCSVKGMGSPYSSLSICDAATQFFSCVFFQW